MAKSPPNGLKRSVHVSYAVDALTLLGLVRFSLKPLLLQFCREVTIQRKFKKVKNIEEKA